MNDAGPTRPTGPDGAGSGPISGGTFAGLVVEGEAGRGGMGVIYRARDPELDRVRALKILAAERSNDPEFRERFRRESRQAAAIEHPNVVPVYRAGEEDGRLFIVMRFVDGPSLAEVLTERGRLPLDEVVELVRQVGAGLDAAHAVGLVHRDVKPANVMLEGEGPARRAFLGDFGISKLIEAGAELTSTGQFVGTVDYVAPEQLEGGNADRRADVYSLACVAFHALVGEPPFRRETQLATMFAHANASRPDPGPEVPSKVREVLKRGMAVKPDHRPASAGEFAAELERAAGSASVARTERLAKPGRTRSWRPVAVGLGVLAAAGVALALLLGGDDEAPVQQSGVETRDFELTGPPIDITVGPGRVWAASPADGSVTAIALDDPQPDPIRIDGQPAAVAVGYDSLWVADRERRLLLRFDPATGEREAEVQIGADPTDLAIGFDDVWIALGGEDEVWRVDPDPDTGDERVVDRIPVGDLPTALAVAEDGMWVANRDLGNVSFIDPGQGHTVGTPVAAGRLPNDLAVGAGSVWVTDNFNGTVIRIDAGTREVDGEPIEVGPLPRGVAFGLGSVWVANGGDGTVTRLDPESGEVVGEPVVVGDQPAGIAIGPDSVWTADFGSSTVTEIRPEP